MGAAQDGAERLALAGGGRTLKLEYYEVGGWSEMSFDIQPWRMRK